MIWSSLSRSRHKNNISVTLISRLMPSSMDSKTLVNREKGFSTYSNSFFSKMKLGTEIWRKTYILQLCFFVILPWLPIMPLWAWSHLSPTQLIRNFSRKWPDKLHETLRRATQHTTVTIHAIKLAFAAASRRTKVWSSATVKANYFARTLSVVRYVTRNNASHNALVTLPSRTSRNQLHDWSHWITGLKTKFCF